MSHRETLQQKGIPWLKITLRIKLGEISSKKVSPDIV